MFHFINELIKLKEMVIKARLIKSNNREACPPIRSLPEILSGYLSNEG